MRKPTIYRKLPKYFISLAIVILVLTVFVPSLPVIAAPVITLTPSSGAVGTTVTISGAVFDSYKGDIIHIFFDTTEIENSPMTIPPDGLFSLDFVVPANATPGQHWVEVRSETTSSSMLAKTSFIVEAAALTLATPEGYAGTSINIDGSGFYQGKPITLYYTNLTQDVLGTVTASATGRFTYQTTVPISAAGFHTIVASNDVGNRAETQFKVLPQLKVNLDSAGPGDLVSASGTGFASHSTVAVIFSTLDVASVQTNDLGSFSVDFTVPAVKPYTYNIRALDDKGNTHTVKFTITAGATLSESVGAAGSFLTVTGSGFSPSQTVTVYYDDIPIATDITDNNGDFTVAFTVPPGGGKHIITVSDGITTKKYDFYLETDPPGIPALLLPINNSASQTVSYFDWSDVTDISIPVTYNLEIASNQNFASLCLYKTGIKDSHYTLTEDDIISAAFKNVPYYWRVKAIDGAGNESEWSDSWVFSVSVPSIPTLVQPTANTIVEFPIHFSWQTNTSVGLPLTYNLQIAANSDFSSLILSKTGLTVPEYLASEEDNLNFEKNMTYYWRVKAIDTNHISSDWSITDSFYFISTAGFPGWATYLLISIGGLIAIALAFRAGRRSAYH